MKPIGYYLFIDTEQKQELMDGLFKGHNSSIRYVDTTTLRGNTGTLFFLTERDMQTLKSRFNSEGFIDRTTTMVIEESKQRAFYFEKVQ